MLIARLMWVAILVPSWASIPIQFPEAMENSAIAMPPAIALLVWGGLSFLFLPLIMVVKNLREGNTDLKLIWHAQKMDIDEVLNNHVWLLTSITEMPNGEKKIIHSTERPEKRPRLKNLGLVELLKNGVNLVWVAEIPVAGISWPAVIPLALMADQW